jgi:threonine aldolase
MTSPDLPPPPEHSFASDNAAGVAPAVMEAIVAANTGAALAYGDDAWTRDAEAAFRELFDAPVEAHLCWGGTGANVVGLACVLESWQAVIATDSAHIVVDECGAPAHFTGASVIPVPHVGGKLVPDSIDPYVEWLSSEHHPQPSVVAISQATEWGTVYSADEIAAVCDRAHANGMVVHLDGARIANACAATGTDVRTLVRDTGVDLMTFGLTKNGGMYGEVVVFLRPGLGDRVKYLRKQAGQLQSKNRFAAAQVRALLDGDLWLDNARHANAMGALLAEKVGAIDGVEVLHAPEANSIFARVPAASIVPLQEWSFFWEWDLPDSVVRWMTSFATTPEDVDRFAAGVAAITARHR